MRILFVSRAYPPVLGGIEKQNYDLSVWLAKHAEVTTIANRRGKKFLPFFFVQALFRVLFSLHRYDVLLLGDGVLAPLGWIAGIFAPQKTIVAVLHGLDVTYSFRVYQALWPHFFMRSLTGFITVSEATKMLAIEHGLPSERIFVIHNGIEFALLQATHTRDELQKFLGQDLTGKKILLTLGRLVRRKGVAWFVKEVMPKLPANVIYIIGGSGPDQENIQKTIWEKNLSPRVLLLGRLSDDEFELLRATADLFIQPNIRVPGDIEGFGIAVIEASASGLPVIASRLEGLQEAIQNGKNGYLVESEKSEDFLQAITTHLDDRVQNGIRFAEFTKERYDWSVISLKYIDLLSDFVKSTRDSH